MSSHSIILSLLPCFLLHYHHLLLIWSVSSSSFYVHHAYSLPTSSTEIPSKRPLVARYAFGSCNSLNEASLWSEIASHSPNYLLLLGDNIYIDQKLYAGSFIAATPSVLQASYQRFREDEEWQKLVRSIGGMEHILATWDDHDYGINNGDKDYVYKNESLREFLNFFEVNEKEKKKRLERGGVYFSQAHYYTQGGKTLAVKIIVLDTRYFKDPKHLKDADILGEEQWKWLTAELNDSQPDIILLLSSIQVLPTQKIVEETWSAYPRSRNRLLETIGQSPCPNIILLSGDVHMAEVSQAYCKAEKNKFRHLWEFTSGGLTHTFTTTLVQNNDSDSKVVKSRSSLADVLFNTYQATYPANFREFRFQDMYKAPHFATIDILFDESENKLGVIEFKTFDHENHSVITKRVGIRKHLPTIEGFDGLLMHDDNCLPYHGKESLIKKLLCILALSLFLFIVVGTIVLAVIWLIAASILYIFFVKEEKRREQLMALHSKKLK